MTRKIDIFDTTLRDGEQSPGASMNTEEKLVVARQLLRLNVDVIEAGFPISSPGDFESVRRIAELAGDAAVALPFQKRRSGIDLFLSRTATFGSRSLCARIRSCSIRRISIFQRA